MIVRKVHISQKRRQSTNHQSLRGEQARKRGRVQRLLQNCRKVCILFTVDNNFTIICIYNLIYIVVYPHTNCRLRLIKLERVKDYLLMEEEFILNQERLKPQEEIIKVNIKVSTLIII